MGMDEVHFFVPEDGLQSKDVANPAEGAVIPAMNGQRVKFERAGIPNPVGYEDDLVPELSQSAGQSQRVGFRAGHFDLGKREKDPHDRGTFSVNKSAC